MGPCLDNRYRSCFRWRVLFFVIHNRFILDREASVDGYAGLDSSDSLVRLTVKPIYFWMKTDWDLLRFLHLTTMSFVCREEDLRRKQVAKQKSFELQNTMPNEVDNRSLDEYHARVFGKPEGIKVGRTGQVWGKKTKQHIMVEEPRPNQLRTVGTMIQLALMKTKNP